MGEETALADIILPDCPYLERWEPESMPNSLWPWLGIRQPVHHVARRVAREPHHAARHHPQAGSGRQARHEAVLELQGRRGLHEAALRQHPRPEGSGRPGLPQEARRAGRSTASSTRRPARSSTRPAARSRPSTACTRRNCRKPTWPARWWARMASSARTARPSASSATAGTTSASPPATASSTCASTSGRNTASTRCRPSSASPGTRP